MTKKIRLIAILVLIVLFVVLSVITYRAYISPQRKGIQIQPTTIVVQEIKKISQLFTSVYYDELVLDTTKLQEKSLTNRVWSGIIAPRPGFGSGKVEHNFREVSMVVIARGKVWAGYDFAELQEEDLIIEGTSVTLHLPPVQILEVIINPSDYEIFMEEGRWTLEEAVALKQRAAGIMRERAMQRGIMERSESMGVEILTSFLLSLGFEQVTIKTGSTDVSEPQWLSPSLE